MGYLVYACPSGHLVIVQRLEKWLQPLMDARCPICLKPMVFLKYAERLEDVEG
jgi:hypothetical protein